MVILECSAPFSYYLGTSLGRSCRLLSSLQDQKLPVWCHVGNPRGEIRDWAGMKTAHLHKDASTRAGQKHINSVLWFDTASTATAQAGHKLRLERESGCRLVNPAHLKSIIKIGDILFTNEILFLALGRKEVQKAATLLFTLVHLPRLPWRDQQLAQGTRGGLQ